jgi:hypothetical protein
MYNFIKKIKHHMKPVYNRCYREQIENRSRFVYENGFQLLHKIGGKSIYYRNGILKPLSLTL